MIVAFLPLPGTCMIIIVSVLLLPPSCWVPRAASSALVAPTRLSLPRIRMFWSGPSMSLAFEVEPEPETVATGGLILAPTVMLLLKFDQVCQTQ